ncbi:MAG: hypothetical protein ACTSQZ_03525 [Candidatus Thorarchaeota archaeon]
MSYLERAPHWLSNSLFYLVEIYISVDDLESAQNYLDLLEKANEVTGRGVPFIDLRYRVAQALMLRKSKRTTSRAKAEEQLKELVDMTLTDDPLSIVVLLNLSETLLEELKTSKDSKLLTDIQEIINRLLKLAQKQQSFLLEAETYVLQSKFTLLELDLVGARRFLTKAQNIADTHQLHTIAAKISNEHDDLLEELVQWEEVTDGSKECDIACRVSAAGFEKQTSRMMGRIPVEADVTEQEEPVSLFLLTEGGLTAFVKTFSTATEVHQDLIGGFLNAIQSFTAEVFAESIDRIKLENYTLLIKFKIPYTIVYVIRGPAYPASQKLNHFIQDLYSNTNCWDALVRTNDTGLMVNETIRTSIESILSQTITT